MTEFIGFPKIPRIFRDMELTEKLDGTNACIIIEQHPFGTAIVPPQNMLALVLSDELSEDGLSTHEYHIYAQSRSRFISIEKDNHGFADWVVRNKWSLVNDLGIGRHYGEWWGHRINRGYGLDHKRFSLFNTKRWSDQKFSTENLYVVPILYNGAFDSDDIIDIIEELKNHGSYAAQGYMNPEGVVIRHIPGGQLFKATIENDQIPKGQYG